jgi:pimeloyl-[acyl-carrier protein] synthase
MVRYVDDQLRVAERSPATEVSSLLVEGLRQRELDRDEAIATWIMLAIAGHETTANLIGNALFALIERPDVLHHLVCEPTRIPAAVEECLRFDTPVPYTARVASERLEIGDIRIDSGQTVYLMMAAANRDPDAFPDPDELDIDRSKTPNHLGFAYGIHFCLGAALARLETEVAIATILPPTRCEAAHTTSRATHNSRGTGTRDVSYRTHISDTEPERMTATCAQREIVA